jgi:hypothetical protein
MKQRIDSIIATCIIAAIVALTLSGAYALNDTSGSVPTGNGEGPPIAVEASPEASPILEETDQPEIITDLPATGAGPTVMNILVGEHTGWHSLGVYSCDWLGRQMILNQWYEYSGYHYSVGTPIRQWFYTGRYC